MPLSPNQIFRKVIQAIEADAECTVYFSLAQLEECEQLIEQLKEEGFFQKEEDLNILAGGDEEIMFPHFKQCPEVFEKLVYIFRDIFESGQ